MNQENRSPDRGEKPVPVLHRLEYLGVQFIYGLFRIAGLDAASAIAGKFLRLIGPLLRAISRRGEQNLRIAFPDWPQEKIDRTIRDVWENLGRTTAEFVHLKEFLDYEENGRVTFEGYEDVWEATKRGDSIIFVTGHFANWEVSAVASQRAGVDYAFVYRPLNNRLVDDLIVSERAKVMSSTQIPKGKTSVLEIVKAIKTNKSLALLVDQKLNDGIPAPFFGRDAMTTPAPAWLSLRYDLPVFPIFVERKNGAYFNVKIGEQIRYSPTGDNDADVSTFTARINDAIEKQIRARPGQWLWLHRRWPKELYR